jgi:DNA-binding beta-propeller fold protein YncE
MNSTVATSMIGMRIGVRVTRVAFAALLFLICTSCGETYRPVAFPIVPSPPSPGTSHFVLTVSGNGMVPSDPVQPPFPGTIMRIDTSGDSVLAATENGLGPVHATVLPNGTAWYVANSLEDTISASTLSASSTHSTIALPDLPGDPTATPPVLPTFATPVFVHTAENGNVYVANYNYGTVSVINTTANIVVANVGVDPTAAIPNVNANPVSLAELPNGSKVYSANRGNGSVTSINTIDHSVGVVFPAAAVGSSPVWVAARSDSQRVYALDKSSGNIAVIDPTTTPDTIVGTVPTEGGADFMLYDGKLNRLYVLSSSGNKFWAFDASPSMPMSLLAAGPISMVPPALGPTPPCSTGVAPIPVSLTALPDGSRVYVASYQKDTGSGQICSQVSVFSSTNYTAGNVISLGSTGIVTNTANYPMGCDAARPAATGAPLGFRLSAASSGDNKPTTRVYVANCDQGNTAVITTIAFDSAGVTVPADSLLTDINSPLSAFPAPAGNPQPPPPPQNPLFIVAGP